MKNLAIIMFVISSLSASQAFAAKPSKSGKKATVKTEKEMKAWADANPEEMKLFESLLIKVADGCRYLWPTSKALQARCVKSEVNNFNEALAAGEFTD